MVLLYSVASVSHPASKGEWQVIAREGRGSSARSQGCPGPRAGGQISSVAHIPPFHPARDSLCQGLAGTRNTCRVPLGHQLRGPSRPLLPRGRARKPCPRLPQGHRGHSSEPPSPKPLLNSPLLICADREAGAYTQELSVSVVVFMVISKQIQS